MAEHGVEKESDYYMRLTREHSAEIKALKADRRRLGVIVRDLAYIAKELVFQADVVDPTFGTALEAHQADLDAMLIDDEGTGVS